jgi:DNA-binding HxlR family transcriptional regulator
VLTQSLRALERDGLLNREQHLEIPPRVEYSLTALGRSAGPVLAAIAEWWKKHAESVRSSAAGR